MRAGSPPGGLAGSGQSPGPAPSAERAAAAVRSSCPAHPREKDGKKTRKRQEREPARCHGQRGPAPQASAAGSAVDTVLSSARKGGIPAQHPVPAARIFRAMPAPGPAGWHLALCPCPRGSVAAPGWFSIAEPAGAGEGSAFLACLASRKAGRHCGPARRGGLQQSDLLAKTPRFRPRVWGQTPVWDFPGVQPSFLEQQVRGTVRRRQES